jgi:hypothetical protein
LRDGIGDMGAPTAPHTWIRSSKIFPQEPGSEYQRNENSPEIAPVRSWR